MKIADDGTLEPWLAESAVNVNATTWEIVIKDAVCFSNGKKCDAAAVKACLEHLIEVHRAQLPATSRSPRWRPTVRS